MGTMQDDLEMRLKIAVLQTGEYRSVPCDEGFVLSIDYGIAGEDYWATG